MKNKRRKIAILSSDIILPSIANVVQGIMKQAYDYDYDVLVFTSLVRDGGTREFQDGEKNIYNLPNYDVIDGVIVLGDCIQMEGCFGEIEERLHNEFHGPVVILDKDSKYFPSISMNDRSTVERLVDHLIEVHGYSKINCLTGSKGHIHAENRLQGYMDSLIRHGIEVEESRYRYGNFWVETAIEYVHDILAQTVPWPEAILCSNDYSAISMIREFQRLGVKVPEDLVVVGYDSQVEGVSYIPSITSAKPPFFEHGRNGVIYLHSVLEGKKEPLLSKVTGELVIAESCRCSGEVNLQYRLQEQNKRTGVMSEAYLNTNFMVEDLASASSIESCMEELCWYTYQLEAFNELYVCLCDNWDGVKGRKMREKENKLGNTRVETMKREDYLTTGYSDTMYIYMQSVERQHRVLEEPFDVRKMIPALWDEKAYPTTYFFTPIHYRDRCLGYMVVNYGERLQTFEQSYSRWSRNANTAIEIQRQQHELLYYNTMLNALAIQDELTGIYNRHGFNEVAKTLMLRAKKEQALFFLLLADMDTLKKINDKYGHLEGDQAIKDIADILSSCCRGDTIASRLGGDEFVITGLCKGEQELDELKQRIYSAIDQKSKEGESKYRLEISMGVYSNYIHKENRSDTDILDEFLHQADKKMYEEKQQKKQGLVHR